MNRLIAIFALSAFLATAGTFTGIITESMCVKDHKAMKMGPDAECIRNWVKADKNVKYVLFDGKNTYKLSDQQTPEKFAAQKVVVSGTLYEKTRVIKVDRIEAAR